MTRIAEKEVKTKVTTGKVRFSYVQVWEPKSINGSDPKYSISVIVSKDDKATLAKIKKAIDIAKTEGKEKFGGKIPLNIKTPLRDGDEDRPEDPAYENCYFFNANSNIKPQIVDRNINEILDRDEFYSGCFGRISINFYAYNSKGNKGIAAGLNNIQKLEDGENLAGRSSAADDFGTDEEDDFLS